MSLRSTGDARGAISAVALLAALAGACQGQIGDDVGGGTSAPDPSRPGAPSMPRPDGPGGAPTDPRGELPPPPAGASTTPPPPPNRAGCALPARRIWKLTPRQYAKTVAALIPDAVVPVDGLRATLAPTGGFANDARPADVSAPHFEQLFSSATALARQAVAKADKLAPCLAKRPFEAACAKEAVAAFAARAYRRPLAAAEGEALAKLYDAEAGKYDTEVALTQALRAILLSPSFLYRTELGEGSGATLPLTPYERASALSYFLTDGPPDPMLMDAARTGALATRAQLEAQARRLIATPAGAQGVLAFFDEHLFLDGVQQVSKDVKRFKTFTPELAADMTAESRRFIEHVLWKGDGRFATLLTSNETFVNDRLAAVYGIAGVTGRDLRLATLPPGRQGLLGHGSFLALRAGPAESDIVRRGKFVRAALMCQTVPPPPPDVAAVPPPPDGVHSQRERILNHSKDPSCAVCHTLLDAPGLAFEAFDAIGAARTTDAGKPIDTTGTLTNLDGLSRPIAGAADLARILGDSPEAQRCFTAKLWSYAHGRSAESSDACALSSLDEAFAKSRGDVRALVVEIAVSDSFLVRTP